jgi:hypothetical protein
MIPCTGDQPCPKAATYTQDNKNTENTHISMSRVGFEPTFLVLEQAKTVHVLDRAATEIGM